LGNDDDHDDDDDLCCACSRKKNTAQAKKVRAESRIKCPIMQSWPDTQEILILMKICYFILFDYRQLTW
jgi:hypothetical protein